MASSRCSRSVARASIHDLDSGMPQRSPHAIMSTPTAMDAGRFPASFPTIRKIPAITNSSPMQRMMKFNVSTVISFISFVLRTYPSHQQDREPQQFPLPSHVRTSS